MTLAELKTKIKADADAARSFDQLLVSYVANLRPVLHAPDLSMRQRFESEKEIELLTSWSRDGRHVYGFKHVKHWMLEGYQAAQTPGQLFKHHSHVEQDLQEAYQKASEKEPFKSIAQAKYLMLEAATKDLKYGTFKKKKEHLTFEQVKEQMVGDIAAAHDFGDLLIAQRTHDYLLANELDMVNQLSQYEEYMVKKGMKDVKKGKTSSIKEVTKRLDKKMKKWAKKYE